MAPNPKHRRPGPHPCELWATWTGQEAWGSCLRSRGRSPSCQPFGDPTRQGIGVGASAAYLGSQGHPATSFHHHFLPSLLFIPNPPATPWLSRGPVPIPNLIVTHVHTQACAPMREGAGLRCPCCHLACPLGLRISAEWGVGGAGSHSAAGPRPCVFAERLASLRVSEGQGQQGSGCSLGWRLVPALPPTSQPSGLLKGLQVTQHRPQSLGRFHPQTCPCE